MKFKNVVLITGLVASIAGIYLFLKSTPRTNEVVEPSLSFTPSDSPASQNSGNQTLSNVQADPSYSVHNLEPKPVENHAHLREEFQEATAHALKAIPTIEDLKTLSDEEVHDTPPQILQAGSEIGKVMDMLAQNPELKPQGVRFYETCAKTHNYPESIRAICYSQLKELDPANFKNFESHVPTEVRDLADMM